MKLYNTHHVKFGTFQWMISKIAKKHFGEKTAERKYTNFKSKEKAFPKLKGKENVKMNT